MQPAAAVLNSNGRVNAKIVTDRVVVAHLRMGTVYGPGQIFAVDHEHPHDESIGPEGARVLVGRKYPKE